MQKLLIDTDVLIDIANNDITAKQRLYQESQTHHLSIASITEMELIVGCRNKTELQNLNQFLNQFSRSNLNENISKIAIQLMQNYNLSYNLLIPDALIAATAISENIPLLSKNQKDYRFISNLDLLSYP
ncbi:type II toxin-antitoxin system VapC family toxin [Spirulina major CS-329]|uniref:type II toxin-antitoxin system VapC family toxin n=1 Tax=Spirulina TaxID=1154 RepID=UPI00232B72ED|nr:MULTISPECIES: type II toxin-antitoxin system VapC family toxin [Spirulina]MDB9494425.1 type II toxin-antitoxin system VapC family toxin [Spirulina subsalsa CS-330]MDB9502398.1 type II toxin-antitoxin system VapC family toxin [Spirulina major CS-329]